MMVEMSATVASPTGSPPAPAGTAATDRTGVAPVAGAYGRVAAWLAKRVEVALVAVDLTPPQYRVLGLLAEGSSAASGLADRLAVRRPSLTALVDGLVARGLVDRRQGDTDRRRVSLRLTEAGVAILAEADRVLDAHLESLAANLSAKDQAAALRSLPLWGRAMAASRQESRRAGHVGDAGPRPGGGPG
jgi:long-chain acyl-CoA synthetase